MKDAAAGATHHDHPAGWSPALAHGAIALAKNVSKDYVVGSVIVPALRNVTLVLPRGEFVVVLGPSGSGKTTLLNLLGGIEDPSAGDLWVDGINLATASPRALSGFRREKVGFVFQFFNLVPTLTARENVELAARLTRRSLPSDVILRDVGLGHRLDHYPSELSGGEQQRVAVARALVRHAPLLLADEPTGELDADTGRRILTLLQRFNRDRGTTIFLVTHNTAIAGMANRVIRMRSGSLASVEQNPHPVDAATLRW